MAQIVKVQDGYVVYSTSDPALNVDFNVAGYLDVTKRIMVGDDTLVDGLVTTPDGTDLIIGTNNSNIRLETPGGHIVLNNNIWPTGAANKGMFIGASALNTLALYPFILGTATSDTLSQPSLNATYPTAQIGQMVLGPAVIYYCVAASTWRTLAAGTGSSAAIAINTQSSDYTLQISDAFNTLIRITSATAAVVTIPNDSTVNMPIGSAPLISWNGSGAVSVAPASGVTIITPDTLSINKQYGKITAIKTGPNYWEIEGNLAPY
jgi:hypothetical protein